MRTFRWTCSGCGKSFLDHFEDDVDLDSFDTDGLCPLCADNERLLTERYEADRAAGRHLPSPDDIPF